MKLNTKTNKKLKIKFEKLGDDLIFEPDYASKILTAAERIFPIKDMGKTFKGNRHLYFDRTSGKLTLSVWTDRKVYDLTF